MVVNGDQGGAKTPLAERLARSRRVLVAAFAGYFPGSSTTEVDFDAQHGALEEAVADRVGSGRAIDVVGFSLGGFRALGLAPVGTADAANPVAKSEAIVHAVPKGTLEIVERAGHALSWEDFDGTVAGIERFFAR